MITVNVEHAADFHGWRAQARELLNAGIDPSHVLWQVSGIDSDLFADRNELTALSTEESPPCDPTIRSTHTVPRSFLELAELVVCHSDASRFGLLYRALWRMTNGDADLLQRATDDDVYTLTGFAKAVSRDRHKMTAFVRFRRTPGCHHEHYAAWFEPSHHILRLTSEFFCKRFSNMDWSIYTPEGSAHWNQAELVFGPCGTRHDIPQGEAMEQLWCTYFANIFNPARLRLDAMRAEMPVKYWKNLPEAPIIARLTREAGSRTSQMVAATPGAESKYTQSALYRAEVPLQKLDSLAQLRESARHCDLCPHACKATQTVFGHGPETARVMIIGEQPGDIEDLRGMPFVGPSGKLLRSILTQLSVDQSKVYFTNAVKHFKYTPRGKRRLHQRPSAGDIDRCRSWLTDEISLIKPALIIALGSTAARSLLGRTVKLTEQRGILQRFGDSAQVMLTHHPARILRASNQLDRSRLSDQLADDLGTALSHAGLLRQDLSIDS
ncbi:MAG: UdgX family uracil-DNA binding protein [Granulosicoccus sp.]|nr:UdgX family uracil-DNA binding protein [Granulosicoccus sp.]